MLTDSENSFTIGNGNNYLQDKYDTSRHLLKTSLHYSVKHKSLKSAFALPIDDKAVNSTINFFKHLKKHDYYFTYLFTALSSNACTIHEFTKLRNYLTFGTAFNRVQLIAQLMEGASWRLRTGQRRTF